MREMERERGGREKNGTNPMIRNKIGWYYLILNLRTYTKPQHIDQINSSDYDFAAVGIFVAYSFIPY